MDVVVQAHIGSIRFARQMLSVEVLKVEVENLGIDFRKLESTVRYNFGVLRKVAEALGEDDFMNGERPAQVVAADNHLDDYVAESTRR